MQPSQYPRTSQRWLSLVLPTAAIVFAALLLALYLVAALGWHSQPFFGVLPHRNLEVSNAASLVGGEWPGRYFGLTTGDHLSRIEGVDFDLIAVDKRLDRFNALLADYAPGDRLSISFTRKTTDPADRPLGATCQPDENMVDTLRCGMVVRLGTMPDGDMLLYFGVGWVSGVLLWLVALFLLLRQGYDSQIQTIVIMSAALAIFMAGGFDRISTNAYGWGWLLATVLAGGALVAFALEFPFRFAIVQETPIWRWTPLVVSVAMAGASTALYVSDDRTLYAASQVLALGMLLLGGLVLLAIMLWRRGRSASPIVRNQSTMVVIGLVPALLPVLAWFLGALIFGEPAPVIYTFNQVFPILLPLSALYAVLQYRLVDTDRVITQSFLYTALLVLLTASYFMIVAGVAYLVGQSTRDTALNPVIIVAAIFVIAVSFAPLRLALQRAIDAAYFRARRAYQSYLEQFSREVPAATSLSDVTLLVHTTLTNAIAPEHLTLFVRHPDTHVYHPQPDPLTGQRATDITFGADSGLVRYLRERAILLYLEEGRPLPLDVVSDRARLAVLGAPLIVGLRGKNALNGFLCIGPRRGGHPYLHEDLRFIDALSDQVALAVERAQAADDLERRVQVQAVLSQVSRALNFAIDLDTLLELIYAQTLRVIRAPNFYIALRDPNLDEMYYVFYNEGDDRVPEMEGRRWRMGRDLISEIARSQQTLRTDDFVRESLLRDPLNPPQQDYLKAWMGVPLLADTGEGALGVMVAATDQPGERFTDEQQDIFWDIANLAVSAINRLQLLEKTQQRARQLAAINEISNQLASEMGNVDRLLHLITENAVQILGTEAGTLFLVDEETGELEFNVVIGGGGEDLIGKRLPPGTGVVGATVQRGQPIIVNDPARDSRWYGEMDEDDLAVPDKAPQSAADNGGGFRSGPMLSVPLMVGGRAIGVLQCLNKRDGGVFVPEDADLLETFAGQAAIAIENARLFDMTDQQLALRVQELDTMQRIDQALNRTLELKNVVDITMDWALRKSGARAGALFMRDRDLNELHIVASYGYPPESPFAEEGRTFPGERGAIGRAVRSGQPSLSTDVSIDPGYQETLPGCVAQLTVPLFSADEVVGVIILESDEDGALDLLDLDFVARLAEHATPAMVNSQLFGELQRANEDKSRFVSFVAHELKNPMTSLKGYTDLLIKGVVGPVNEQQGDFLSTIYNNVIRMETLVSDLNDLTKQQTDNLRLDLASLDFGSVVGETLRAQQRMIDEKKQQLVLDVPNDLPPVYADQNRLIQVMTNFVSNANKYTPPGGTITIRAALSANRWDPHGPPEVIHCTVQDTGIGMSEDDLGKLFTPYFRSENPKTREQPGTGLGLAITRGLIEQHGGMVWVESTPEVGTTFHFTIPVSRAGQAAGAAVRTGGAV